MGLSSTVSLIYAGHRAVEDVISDLSVHGVVFLLRFEKTILGSPSPSFVGNSTENNYWNGTISALELNIFVAKDSRFGT